MLRLVLCETVGLAKLQGHVACGKCAMKSPICDAEVTCVVRVLSEISSIYGDWTGGAGGGAGGVHTTQFAYNSWRSFMRMYDSLA